MLAWKVGRVIDEGRRRFLKLAARATGTAATLTLFAPSIRRALALPAATVSGTLSDVQHVVILMQENRSFDHYFGTLRGVRGFGDRHPVPLASGKPVWYQSNGESEIPPFSLDTQTTSALLLPSTPHTFSSAQAAWNQGKFGFWPRYKSATSMGYYRRADIPFQFALAEAFTICDAYHCSVMTGTDPNRITFWSGSNFDPAMRARGTNCTAADSEPDNLRCLVKGAVPTPGYRYSGSAFTWPTIAEVLQQAGISWRIYQNPNDNWTGLMHGGLAFESFRSALPGSAIYENGMTHWSIEQFARDVQSDTLPQVSWVLPPAVWSEHPGASTAVQGAEFTSQVLDALTSNPTVWGRTVFFVAFDENDGLFDHVPPPAPPSYNPDGSLAGKSTVDLAGMYFSDPERAHLLPSDRTSGTVRPWGLGPRVPFYIVSPWSRGGWVCSQVFDHTSVGQFLERRFGVTLPAISPWNRAISGDLTSAFDFVHPNAAPFSQLPDPSNYAVLLAAARKLPSPMIPPASSERLFQETGVRPSRALPYEIEVSAASSMDGTAVTLTFENTGRAGVVLHVYDKQQLDLIPHRYTIEAGKALSDSWPTHSGSFDLWVYGPNGFVREFTGEPVAGLPGLPRISLQYAPSRQALEINILNTEAVAYTITVVANAYYPDDPQSYRVAAGSAVMHPWPLAASYNWYDFTLSGPMFAHRFAGRVETGEPSVSDPAL